jgi:outer membrane protein OmpA-like peptidoglycan-associated protein
MFELHKEVFMRARVVLFAVLVALVTSGMASAEPQGSYVYLAPLGGFTVFDAKGTILGSTLADRWYAGGRFGWQSAKWYGLEIAGGFTPTNMDQPPRTKVTMIHGSVDMRFTLDRSPYGGPFILVGANARRYKFGAAHDNQGGLELGTGLDFWLNDAWGVRLEGRDMMWQSKSKLFEKPLSHTIVFGAGVTWAIGATPRDTDGDGIPDRKDKCPGTPHGATVDATGCPKDSDGDGVLDGIDQCPGTPKGATVDAKGCPSDADGDGVFDGIDQCPDTPKGATVDAKGCTSDSDGDGVVDGIDQCPDTPKGATVDAKGCPKDSDGDGVPDGLDKCPDTAAGLKVDKDGCPIEVMDKETELLDTGSIVLQDVNFETAKANILPASLHSLDVVGQVLSKWAELKIEIGGHTDSRGGVKYNQKLSEARVDSVRAYLLAHFPALKPEQFTAKGYGKSKPLVPNTSPLNMAKNRRVEFKVMNREVLKHEIERRKLLKQGENPSPPPSPPPPPPDTTQTPPKKP